MRKWIIVAAVAVVLVGGAGGAWALWGGDPPPEEPGGGDALSAASAYPVEVGDITDTVVLDAVVEEDPAKEVVAKRGGTVTRVWVGEGQEVEQGAPIVTVRAPVEAPPGGGEDADGGDGPRTREVNLTAPVDGKVTGLGDLEAGDPVEPGGAVASISGGRYRAVAEIPPNDLYRFYDDPEEITLKIDKGPPAETCELMSLGAKDASSDSGSDDGGGEGPEGLMMPGSDSGGGEATAQLTCRVPDDMKVFAGVTGKVSVTTGSSEGALLVPATAVRGGSEEGQVVVVGPDGAEEERDVVLGITDGEMIEVTEGLKEGEQVLDPVPLSEEFDVPGGGGGEGPEGGVVEVG
ncbi:efflux RND transporter periplasmic adaptor subunit [Nocardiopsis suaedae]|uniref:HlyD family efflux transporter periplasmic adaptor subunit n=1 Tax=Nocardiopsis suaedae TaxID=3018444 RepID=A0ABT4TGZ2_9ACTN|nr:HlyD family efflux transporter periplasmic adaptor subunit [Nocardiopsis suaedae]MDA2803660.1 HlyD family efflux transporter periplasmic adaptor subunit [Nocardiopsis suaedae]